MSLYRQGSVAQSMHGQATVTVTRPFPSWKRSAGQNLRGARQNPEICSSALTFAQAWIGTDFPSQRAVAAPL